MKIESNKLVTFRLGDDLFAADIFSVERVLRYTAPTSVPDMPDYIEGVIDYQGRVVPIVNLRRRFEMPDARGAQRDAHPHPAQRAANGSAPSVDAVTDGHARSIRRPSRRRRAVPRARGRVPARGSCACDEKLVIFLDVERLLSSTERIALDRAAAEALANG